MDPSSRPPELHEGLIGALLKIGRAKKHFEELNQEIAEFVKSRPFRIVKEVENSSGDELYRVKVLQAVPNDWACAIGDVIHNLRTALDHVAVALVIHNGVTARDALKSTYFPISASSQLFNVEKMSRASDKAQKFIKSLQPFRGGDDRFWQLHQLDILDKHIALLPVGGVHNAVITHTKMHVPWNEKPFSFPPLRLRPAELDFPIKDGAIVLRVAAQVGSQDRLLQDYEFHFDLVFGDSQIVDGEPIFKVLSEFFKLVEGVVSRVNQEVFAHPKAP